MPDIERQAVVDIVVNKDKAEQQYSDFIKKIEEPVKLEIDADVRDAVTAIKELQNMFKALTNQAKDGEKLRINVQGMAKLQQQLAQVDDTLSTLSNHFTGLRRSVDIQAELNDNQRALQSYQNSFKGVVDQINKLKSNRTTDDFFNMKSTKTNIKDILSGASFKQVYEDSQKNASRLLVEIAKAAQETDGLAKTIQLSETQSVSLADIFKAITTSIEASGKSLSDLKIEGLSADIIDVLKNIQKLESEIPTLQAKFDDAVNREKAGSINVQIDAKSIESLSDAISELKGVFKVEDGSTIGFKEEDIQRITSSFSELQTVLENIHNLLSSFDLPKIKAPEVETREEKPRRESRSSTTVSTTMPTINGGTRTVTNTSDSSTSTGGVSGVEATVDGQNRLQQELRETRQEAESTQDVLQEVGKQESPTALDKKVAELQYLHDKVRTIFDGRDGIINEDMSYSEKFDSSEVQRMITLLSQLSDAELKATMGIEGEDWVNEFRQNLQSEINVIKESQDEIQKVRDSASGVNESGLDVGELDIMINDRLEHIYEMAQNVARSFDSSLTPSVKEFLSLIENNLDFSSMSDFMMGNAKEIDRYINDIIHNGKSVKEVFTDMENRYGWDTARFDNLIDQNVPTELKGLYDSLFSDVENRIKSAEEAAEEFNAKLREFKSNETPVSSGITALPEQEQAVGQAGQQMGQEITSAEQSAITSTEELISAIKELEEIYNSFDRPTKEELIPEFREKVEDKYSREEWFDNVDTSKENIEQWENRVVDTYKKYKGVKSAIKNNNGWYKGEQYTETDLNDIIADFKGFSQIYHELVQEKNRILKATDEDMKANGLNYDVEYFKTLDQIVSKMTKDFKGYANEAIQNSSDIATNNEAYREEIQNIQKSNEALRERYELLRNGVINYAFSKGISQDKKSKLQDAIPYINEFEDYTYLGSFGEGGIGAYFSSSINVLEEVCKLLGIEIPGAAQRANDAINEVVAPETQTLPETHPEEFEREASAAAEDREEIEKLNNEKRESPEPQSDSAEIEKQGEAYREATAAAEKFAESKRETSGETPSSTAVSESFQRETEAVREAMTVEEQALNELKQKLIGEIPNAVDTKTQAFRSEQVEVSNLIDLEIGKVEELAKVLQSLFKGDSDSGVMSGLKDLFDSINRVKINKDTVQNLTDASWAIDTIGESFKKLSNEGLNSSAFDSLNDLLKKGEELKSLAKILDASEKKIATAGKAAGAGTTGKTTVNPTKDATAEYKELLETIQAATKAKTELNKIETKQVNGKTVDAQLADATSKSTGASKAAADAMARIDEMYKDGVISVEQYTAAQKALQDSLKGTAESVDALATAQKNAVQRQLKSDTQTQIEIYRKESEEYKKLYRMQNSGGISTQDEARMANLVRYMTDQQTEWNEKIAQGAEFIKKMTGGLKTVAQLQADVSQEFSDKWTKSLNNQLETMEKQSSWRKGNWKEIIEKLRQEATVFKENIGTRDYEENQKAFDALIGRMKATMKSEDFLPIRETWQSSFTAKIETWANQNKIAAKEFGEQLKTLKGQIAAVDNEAEASRLENIFSRIQSDAASKNLLGKSLGDRFKDQFKNTMTSLATYYLSFQDFIRYGREAISVVTELDTQLTEMRKVSNESLQTLQQYQLESFDIADRVGTTAAQIQSSTADWLRLGKNLPEAANMAEISTKLLNVSEFTDIKDATDALVSATQAYTDVTASDIVDKLNLIGNNFAVSTDELAQGLQNAGAVLKTQGNDLDQTLALLTSGNLIGQDMSKASAGIRTVSLRIAGTEEAKNEIADMGEDIDDFVVRTRSKTDQIIRDYTAVASNMYKGVSVLDPNGNLRSTYDILLDISKIYEEIQQEDKTHHSNRAQALIETLAGLEKPVKYRNIFL